MDLNKNGIYDVLIDLQTIFKLSNSNNYNNHEMTSIIPLFPSSSNSDQLTFSQTMAPEQTQH